eukprot:Lithocolla_globosa_v1_NODE_2830_length_1855_cov_6.504444.p2 type:complete len:160 gc:universal NODE_2830_length_1855_cov_6.504444:1066-1545(+)
MPEEGSTLKFKNFTHHIPIPFSITGDFESFINSNSGEHTANSYAYKVVCHIDSKYSKPLVLKHGTALDCMNDLQREANEILDLYKSKRDSPIKLSKDERSRYNNTWICDYCDCQIFDKATLENISHEDKKLDNITNKNLKVRDHCHLTGKFRAVSCLRL